MKQLMIALTALALSACSVGTPPPTTPTATPGAVATVVAKADAVILTGERAFAVAELAYITAAKGVGIWADSGTMPASVATRIRGWNAEARDLLVKGKATADAAERARSAARLLDIAGAIDAITGRK